jgi:hypothetical protein
MFIALRQRLDVRKDLAVIAFQKQWLIRIQGLETIY